jgi:hypothetical protein
VEPLAEVLYEEGESLRERFDDVEPLAAVFAGGERIRRDERSVAPDGLRHQGLVPLSDGPASHDAMLYEWVRLDEPLGRLAVGEDPHRPARRCIVERADHQKMSVSVELLPQSPVGFDVQGNLGAEVITGFVEENVFHRPNLISQTFLSASDDTTRSKSRQSSSHSIRGTYAFPVEERTRPSASHLWYR